MLSRRALNVMPKLVRGMASGAAEARPMTRFVQYPFDKTKMTEVTEWFNGTGIAATIVQRGAPRRAAV